MSTEVLREHRGVTVSPEVLPTATLDELQGRLWHDVAPLLAPPASAGASAACPGESQGQRALVPAAPGLWTVTSGWPSASGGPRYAQRRVPFAALPAAIADVAARLDGAPEPALDVIQCQGCEQEEKDQAR